MQINSDEYKTFAFHKQFERYYDNKINFGLLVNKLKSAIRYYAFAVSLIAASISLLQVMIR